MSLKSSQIVELLRAAGESTRLRILTLLAREELAVTELTSILDQSQPRVSRHLKLLAEAGLIERFPDGAWVFYRLPAGGDCRTFLNDVIGLIEPDDRLGGGAAPRGQGVGEGRRAADGGA
jgi:DNA-binding transcriptional ArsR family regulator